MTPGPPPPRISEWILRAVLPAGEHGRSIRAGMREEFHARANEQSASRARSWYRRQALSLGLHCWPAICLLDARPSPTRQSRSGQPPPQTSADEHQHAACDRLRIGNFC
jgi:hypothetical protein